MRIKHSLGKIHHNKGKRNEISREKYVLDYSREFFIFDIVPMGAVRMSNSDRWKTNPSHPDPKKRQRKCVTEYFNFKNLLTLQAKQLGYELGDTLDIVFLVPMPNSWSNKKKEKMLGLPCQSKPDIDNIFKGILDSLKKNDADVWWGKAEKRWSYKGSIIVFP